MGERRKTWRNVLAEKMVLRGDRKAYMQRIKALEWASKEEIAAWQEAQLSRVLSDAKKNIPYYRMHASGNRLTDFPVLKRNVVKDHAEELSLPERITTTTIRDTTSGTTSLPVSFLLDRGHRERGAMQKAFFSEWAGCRLGDPIMKIWGVFPSEDWRQRMRMALSLWIRNMKMMDVVNVPAAVIDRYVQEIESSQPELIIGYANSMMEMAQYLYRKGRTVDYRGTILSSTSSLTPDKYEKIHRVFQCPIFDRYGSREMVDIACDCDRHEGLHVSPFMHHVEILDEADKPCPPGVMGRVVITQLFNPVMPLIRYDMGDMATWAEEPCSCGRNWPLLKTIDGRAISIFKQRDGGLISSYNFIVLVNKVIGQSRIIRMQIIQEDYNRFLVRLVLRDPEHDYIQPSEVRQMEERIGKQIGEQPEILFEVVEEIPLQASGKYLQSICKIQTD